MIHLTASQNLKALLRLRLLNSMPKTQVCECRQPILQKSWLRLTILQHKQKKEGSYDDVMIHVWSSTLVHQNSRVHSESNVEPEGEPDELPKASVFAEAVGLPWCCSSLPFVVFDLADRDLILTPIGKGSCTEQSGKCLETKIFSNTEWFMEGKHIRSRHEILLER